MQALIRNLTILSILVALTFTSAVADTSHKLAPNVEEAHRQLAA